MSLWKHCAMRAATRRFFPTRSGATRRSTGSQTSCARISRRWRERRRSRVDPGAAAGTRKVARRGFQSHAQPLRAGALSLPAFDKPRARALLAQGRPALRPVVRRAAPADAGCGFPRLRTRRRGSSAQGACRGMPHRSARRDDVRSGLDRYRRHPRRRPIWRSARTDKGAARQSALLAASSTSATAPR